MPWSFRFRRSIKLGPIKVNVTKDGLSSVTTGIRGAHYTISRKGTRTTFGLPGTGLSATDYEPYKGGRRWWVSVLIFAGFAALYFLVRM